MPTVHLLIKGKVQGVFFRATTKEKADKFGLTGWVQNTPDDCVEIVASGAEEALQKLADWCRKGPALACVTDVIQTKQQEETFGEFVVRR